MPALINVPVNPAVPGAYIQTIAPSINVVTGVPTDTIGVVGTAAWGPVNSPTPFGSGRDYAQKFGALQARKYDMGSCAAAAILQGAANFRGVRVTDGTDVAASATIYGATAVVTVGGTGHAANDVLTFSTGAQIKVLTVSAGVISTLSVITPPTANTAGALAQTASTGAGVGATITFTYTTGLTLTSLYTGSGANADTAVVSAGSAVGTVKLTLSRPGLTPEVFDNIAGAANAAWVAMAAAVNSGLSGLRGPSGLCVATAGASTVTPLPQSYTLTGGADGVTSITGAVLIGVDTGTRTGMYALRGNGPGLLVLADCDTSTTWTTQIAFALSEGWYAIMTGPSGEYTAPATVAVNKASAGVDSYAGKLLVGDWPSLLDTVNGGAARAISPQGFEAGRLATLGPHQSSLNKPMQGIVATQKSAANQTYSQADLTIFGSNGLDLITNNQPGGSYFGARFGRNTSSNAAINGDNYSRMIPFLAYSLGTTVGQFVGKLQTKDQRRDAKATIDGFLFGLWNPNSTAPDSHLISNPQGAQPYSVVLDDSNNPTARVNAGFEQCDVKVQLGPVIVDFVLNLEAGQTVQVQVSVAA